jgi:hypothetical protein
MADLASIGLHKRPPLPGARAAPFRTDSLLDRALGRPDPIDKLLGKPRHDGIHLAFTINLPPFSPFIVL